MTEGDRIVAKPAAKKAETKKAKIERLRARLEVLTGKGTEEMRASLQAQIDELEGKPTKGSGS